MKKGAYLAAIGLSVIGLSGCTVYGDFRMGVVEKSSDRYELQTEDLNGNGLPEQFYEVNGDKAFLSIDGKNLEDQLDSR